MSRDRQDLRAIIEAFEPALRARVFTHASWLTERGDSYERLEFLGDAVLGAAVAAELYRRFPTADEGGLAVLKAQVVSRASCAEVARSLDLGRHLLERGLELERDDADQLAANPSVLAALTEAVIGAGLLACGYDAVAAAVAVSFAERVEWAERGHIDHKTELQEILQRQGRSVQYAVVSDTGPAHARTFESVASVDGRPLGRGSGTTKKRSEQEAARAALAELGGQGR